MFDALTAAIDELEVPGDPDALRQVLGLADRLRAKIATAVAAFDHDGLAALDHATSTAAWLRSHAGVARSEAGRLAWIAQRTRSLGAVGPAWSDGRLTGAQVERIAAAIPSRLADLFASTSEAFVEAVSGATPAETEHAVRRWLEVADHDGAEPEPDRPGELHCSRTIDDRWRLDGTLDRDGGELVATALRVAADGYRADDARTPAQRRADALVTVASFFLDHQNRRPGGRHRPHVSVVVDADDLHEGRDARYLDGTPASRPTFDALLCDCTIHRVVLRGGSQVVDVGRATRVVSPALFGTVSILDGACCRFPGCDRPATWCDAHHVRWFRDGGETAAGNLVLLCRRHHTLVHSPGWRARLHPDRTFQVTDPSGRDLSSPPPRRPPPAPPPAIELLERDRAGPARAPAHAS